MPECPDLSHDSDYLLRAFGSVVPFQLGWTGEHFVAICAGILGKGRHFFRRLFDLLLLGEGGWYGS